MNARGSVYRACACRGPDGKQLGRRCPKLTPKSKHGRWAFIVELPPGPDGKRRQHRRTGFASQDSAQAELDKLRGRLGVGQEVDDKETVGEWLTKWLDAQPDLRPSTRRSYRQHLDSYLVPHLGHIPLEKLRVEHIGQMFRTIETGNADRERKVGPATMQRVRATLRSALSAAVDQQRITVNPAKLVKMASAKRPKALVWTDARVATWKRTEKLPSPVMVWTPDQTGAFLDHAADDRLYALYHLIAFRGLRRGEGVGVQWSDIDLEAGLLTISQQIVQLGWATEVGAPKSDAGERVIALDDATVEVLKAHRRRQLQERLKWGEAWTDTGLVFARESGESLHPAYVTSHFEVLIRGAKLPPVRLHDLRHGAASLAYAATKDAKVVQALLGHSQISLTLDTYTSLFEDVERDAAEAVALLVPRQARGQ